jgi:hypothetical protein
MKMEKTSSDDSEWQEFEKAVAGFLKALDPTATVRHNITTSDADTGAPRQRDVWVEGRLCRVIPIKVLISCKRYNRTLNEQDIDHFIGEFMSSGGNKGVIYSYSGFNRLAIQKALSHNISCMRLYQDSPPDIPEVLVIPNFYCCYPRFALSAVWKEDEEGVLNTWGDFLERKAGDDIENETNAQYVARKILELQNVAMNSKDPGSPFPKNWTYEITYFDPEKPNIRARIRLDESWDIFESNLEAYNINGSYSITEREFMGTIATPVIDTWSSHPGPGWTKLGKLPEATGNSGAFIFLFGDLGDAILKYFRDKPLLKNKHNGRATSYNTGTNGGLKT